MQTFRDAAGRTWTIAITLGAVMRVRAKLKVDLLQPEADDPPLLTRLATDEILAGEVICELLMPQIETLKISADEVREAFDGATMRAAQDAFWAEYADFFRARGRVDRVAAIEKQKELLTEIAREATRKIAEITLDDLKQRATLGSASGA